MFCISCAAGIPSDASFCSRCGRQLDRVMRMPALPCGQCRAANPNDATFCWQCGKRLERDPITPAADLLLPGSSMGALLSSEQASYGTAPMVQGTPQVSGIPMVQGTPSSPFTTSPAGQALAPGEAPPAQPGFAQAAPMLPPPMPPLAVPSQPPVPQPASPPAPLPGHLPAQHPAQPSSIPQKSSSHGEK